MRRLAPMIGLTVALFFLGNILLRFAGVMVWDDAYFFGRYADNFWEVGNWAWNVNDTPEYGLTSIAYGGFVLVMRMVGGPMAATLWLGSLAWGLVAVFFVYRLVKSTPRSGHPHTRLAGIFILISAGLFIPQLTTHFTSGMDTMLAVAYMAGYLLLFKRWETKLSPSKGMVLGLIGALAYAVRPELLLFSIGLPLATWIWSKRKLNRTQARYLMLFTACFVLGEVFIISEIVSDPLPMAFSAKAGFAYGDSFRTMYRMFSLEQLGWFLLWNLIPFTMIGLGVSTGFRNWWQRMSPVDRGLAIGLVIYLVCESVLVLQVMGYQQRFFMPILPVVYYLAVKSLSIYLNAHTDLFTQGDIKFKAGVKIVSLLGLGVALLGISWLKRPANLSRDWGKFEIQHIYQAIGEHNWPLLQEWDEFPDDLSIASTELGIPGALHPKKRIEDLSGLHSSEIEHGTNVHWLLQLAPDVIYLPHPDYREMNRIYAESEEFQEAYQVYPASALQSFLGIALHRESRYYEALRMRVFDHLENL